MSDFKAKMHQIRFPKPDGGAYSAPPDPLLDFKGPTSKGRKREGIASPTSEILNTPLHVGNGCE